jgi:hypothetical protein
VLVGASLVVFWLAASSSRVMEWIYYFLQGSGRNLIRSSVWTTREMILRNAERLALNNFHNQIARSSTVLACEKCRPHACKLLSLCL